MSQSIGTPKTPTPDLDVTTMFGTPRTANKRATSHIASPDLEHQVKKPKKLKSKDQAQEEMGAIECDETATFGNTVNSRSPEWTDESSISPQQDPSAALVAQYEEDLDHLRSQIAVLNTQMQQLEAQFPIKNKQLQELKKFIAVQHLQKVAVMTTQGPDTQGPDDSAVASKFLTLRHAIAGLTWAKLSGQPFYKPTKIDHKNLFARLTKTEEDYKEYLGDPDGFKSFFFEGVIWKILIDRLLCNPLSAFLDIKEGLVRDQVYGHGGASPQKFHAWRAYTADFLQDAFGPRSLWGPRGALRPQLVGELVELLSRYAKSGTGNLEGLTHQLDDIVEKAVELAWIMAKSRAYWVCGFPTCPETKLPHGFVCPKELMKIERYLIGGRRGIVDLIGRPSLLRYGDSNGEQYDTHSVVYHAAGLVFEGKKANDDDSSYRDC